MQNSSTQPFNTTIQPLVTFYSRLSNHEVAFDDEWKPQLVSLIWNKNKIKYDFKCLQHCYGLKQSLDSVQSQDKAENYNNKPWVSKTHTMSQKHLAVVWLLARFGLTICGSNTVSSINVQAPPPTLWAQRGCHSPNCEHPENSIKCTNGQVYTS